MLIAVFVSILLYCQSLDATILKKHYVQNNQSLCIDGSRASYYTHLSSISSIHPKWVIYVEDGGAFCWEEENCRKLIQAAPYFTTSDDKFHPPEITGYGPFSNDSHVSPWADANFLFIPYCSSDAWLFDNLHLLSGEYYVRGSLILKSILREVLTSVQKSNTQLVLIGSSAGAIGVFNHMSYLTDVLQFPSANVQMILDSWNMPVPVFDSNSLLKYAINHGSSLEASSVRHVWVKDAPCVFSFDCMLDNGFIPAGVKTLIVASTYDAVLYFFIQGAAAHTDTQSILVNYFSQAGAISQSVVNAYYRNAHTTVFIAGCSNHLYITPINPAYREVQSDWNEEQVQTFLSRTGLQLSMDAAIGDVAFSRTDYGPFRWDTANFGSSQFTNQYHRGETLGEMVRIWTQSNTSDIVGSLCVGAPNCDNVCSHETVTATISQTRVALYQTALVLCSIGMLLCVAIMTFLVHIDKATSVKVDNRQQTKKEKVAVDSAVVPFNLQEFKIQKKLLQVRLQKAIFQKIATTKATSTKLQRLQSRITLEEEEERKANAMEVLSTKLGQYIRRMRMQKQLDTAENLVSLRGHVKRCDGSVAVSWASLHYQPSKTGPHLLNGCWGQFRFGRLMCIFGSSGSGKSTLLKVLAGKVKIGVFGGIFQKHALLHCQNLMTGRDISFVHQFETGAIPCLTVEENLYFRIKLARKNVFGDDTIIRDEINDLLDRTGLQARRYVPVGSLSGGQLKRIAIGLELIMNDPVLFLDEPTSGLDGTSSLEIMTLLKKEATTYGKSVAVVIHQPRNEIFELIDDLLLLKAGKTMYCGTCQDFMEQVFPFLAPIDTDATGDRIVDHITHYDDFDQVTHPIPPHSSPVPAATTVSAAAASAKQASFTTSLSASVSVSAVSGHLDKSFSLTSTAGGCRSTKHFEEQMWLKRHHSSKFLSSSDALHSSNDDDDLALWANKSVDRAIVLQIASQFFNRRTLHHLKRTSHAIWDDLFLLDARPASSLATIATRAKRLHIKLHVSDTNGNQIGRQNTATSSAANFTAWTRDYVASLHIVALLIQRLFRAMGQTYGVWVASMTGAILYPMLGVFFAGGFSAFDIITTTSFFSILPLFMTMLTLSVEIDVNFKLVYMEMADGVYSYSALLAAFLFTFSFVALCIQAIALFSIFLIRAETDAVELLSAMMFLTLLGVFVVALMITSTFYAGYGSNTTVAVKISATVLTVLSVFSGIPFNIIKFPVPLRWLMSLNPLFIITGSMLYLNLQACQLEIAGNMFGDPDLCRAMTMSAWGYQQYSERGSAACVIVTWIVGLVLLAWWLIRQALNKASVTFVAATSAATTFSSSTKNNSSKKMPPTYSSNNSSSSSSGQQKYSASAVGETKHDPENVLVGSQKKNGANDGTDGALLEFSDSSDGHVRAKQQSPPAPERGTFNGKVVPFAAEDLV